MFVTHRLNEIRVLKVRLADMRRELHVLRTGVANVDVLKREVSRMSFSAGVAPERRGVTGIQTWRYCLNALACCEAQALISRALIAPLRPSTCPLTAPRRLPALAASCYRSAPRSRLSVRSWRAR